LRCARGKIKAFMMVHERPNRLPSNSAMPLERKRKRGDMSAVVATWDIRSENRPIENDCLSLLARKYDKSIQSERITMLACNENPWS